MLPRFDDSISNHNAKQIYANYKLTRMFGGKERARYPHVPIMINRDIMEGMSFINLITHILGLSSLNKTQLNNSNNRL